MLKRLIAIFCVWSGIAACATVPYDSIAVKAERFYVQKEWLSALAMCDLMLVRQPAECATYVRAIASAAMVGDTLSQQRLTRSAIEHRVVVDSLFGGVERASIALGKPAVYEDYLETVVVSEPWLRRAVDLRLLHYFAFRHNGEKTVECARRMLDGLPDNVEYLELMAQGYLDCGDMTAAERVYSRVVEISPDNVTALLYLGNALWDRGNKKAGAEYLRRAYDICPTPYLEAKLGIRAQCRR